MLIVILIIAMQSVGTAYLAGSSYIEHKRRKISLAVPIIFLTISAINMLMVLFLMFMCDIYGV